MLQINTSPDTDFKVYLVLQDLASSRNKYVYVHTHTCSVSVYDKVKATCVICWYTIGDIYSIENLSGK